MEFQNNNGEAVKELPAKTNQTAASNGPAKHQTPAKAQHGNRTETKAKPATEEKTGEQKPAEAENTGTGVAVIPVVLETKPAAELPKLEIKAEKPVLTLEAKLKAVNELHRKSIQRLALIARIKTLEDFELKLHEENDELESNPYQGCKLIIKDDRAREFVTNTPGLIRMVSQFIFEACHNKLEEIESTINFPEA